MSYKSTKNELKKEIKRRKEESQDYVINMNVNNDNYFLSEFSENDTPVISREVAEFIEDSTPSLRKKEEQLTLCIASSCIDDCEKELYRRAIKEYYTERYISCKEEIRRDYVIAGILAIVGILVLVLAVFVGYHSEIWSEVVNIVAWVFVWEAVYIAFLETRKLKHDSKRYIAYISMKIEYIDVNK